MELLVGLGLIVSIASLLLQLKNFALYSKADQRLERQEKRLKADLERQVIDFRNNLERLEASLGIKEALKLNQRELILRFHNLRCNRCIKFDAGALIYTDSTGTIRQITSDDAIRAFHALERDARVWGSPPPDVTDDQLVLDT